MKRHRLLCRLFMALATRRVCTCGASKQPYPTLRYRIKQWHRGRQLRRR